MHTLLRCLQNLIKFCIICLQCQLLCHKADCCIWMIRLLGNTTNPYIIMLVFFLVPFILTQVMSNLATLTIFIPLVTSACIRMGIDPRAAVVGVITASCISIMTPMAAPCQIMIIEPGGYKLRDYLRCGTPLALILIVVSVFFLPMLFPLY